MKNTLRGLLVIFVVVGIFYLTFQTPSETMELSEGFRHWLIQHGIVWDSPTVRSNAHLPMYFALGFSLCLWLGWRKALLIGPIIGTIDETLKVYLPTRHFDYIDLCKDFIGIFAGIIVVCILRKILYREKPVY